jgi:hypothetical protein
MKCVRFGDRLKVVGNGSASCGGIEHYLEMGSEVTVVDIISADEIGVIGVSASHGGLITQYVMPEYLAPIEEVRERE